MLPSSRQTSSYEQSLPRSSESSQESYSPSRRISSSQVRIESLPRRSESSCFSRRVASLRQLFLSSSESSLERSPHASLQISSSQVEIVSRPHSERLPKKSLCLAVLDLVSSALLLPHGESLHRRSESTLFLADWNRLLLQGESLPKKSLFLAVLTLVFSALLLLHGESRPRRSESNICLAIRNRNSFRIHGESLPR